MAITIILLTYLYNISTKHKATSGFDQHSSSEVIQSENRKVQELINGVGIAGALQRLEEGRGDPGRPAGGHCSRPDGGRAVRVQGDGREQGRAGRAFRPHQPHLCQAPLP